MTQKVEAQARAENIVAFAQYLIDKDVFYGEAKENLIAIRAEANAIISALPEAPAVPVVKARLVHELGRIYWAAHHDRIDANVLDAMADACLALQSSPSVKAAAVDGEDEADIYEQAATLGIPATGGDFLAGIEAYRKQLRLRAQQIRSSGARPGPSLLSDPERVSDSPGVRESEESTSTNSRLEVAIALAMDRGSAASIPAVPLLREAAAALSQEREARKRAESIEAAADSTYVHWRSRTLTAEASLAEAKRLLKPLADAKGHFDGHVRDEDTVEIALRNIRAHHVRAAARFLSQEPNP
jgi:hypothetical protein